MTQHTPNVIVHPNGALIGKCGACDVASFGASRITPCDTHKRAEGSHAQHTPGPWTVDDCPDADGYDTIRLADGTLNGNTEAQPIATAYSHAALIAAAPAMLEALRSCLDLLEANESDDEWGREFAKPRADAARAALAAAEARAEANRD